MFIAQGVILSTQGQKAGEWQIFITPSQRNDYQLWSAFTRTSVPTSQYSNHSDNKDNHNDDNNDDRHKASLKETQVKVSKITVPSPVTLDAVLIYKRLLLQKCSDALSVDSKGVLYLERYNSNHKQSRNTEDGMIWNHVTSTSKSKM